MPKNATADPYSSEEAARDHLLDLCWQGGKRHCPRCRTAAPYELAEGRLRCSGCRYTFHDFTGRWLNLTGLSCRQWLTVVRAFAQELGTREVAEQATISYNTALKALTALRLAIVARGADAQQMLTHHTGLAGLLEGGRLHAGSDHYPAGGFPVYGLMSRGRHAFVDLLPELSVESILHFNHNFHLRVRKHGHILVTDRYRSYEALLVCGDDTLPYHYLRSHQGEIFAESGGCPFWSYARERLGRFKGLSWQRFPLYLKELELRHNNQNANLVPLLLAALCAPIPTRLAFPTE